MRHEIEEGSKTRPKWRTRTIRSQHPSMEREGREVIFDILCSPTSNNRSRTICDFLASSSGGGNKQSFAKSLHFLAGRRGSPGRTPKEGLPACLTSIV